MKPPLLTKDLVPVHEFRANLASWLGRPSQTGRPLVLTQRGKAAAVVVSPGMLDDLEEKMDVARQILRGLREVAAGEVVDDDEVWADVEEILGRAESESTESEST